MRCAQHASKLHAAAHTVRTWLCMAGGGAEGGGGGACGTAADMFAPGCDAGCPCDACIVSSMSGGGGGGVGSDKNAGPTALLAVGSAEAGATGTGSGGGPWGLPTGGMLSLLEALWCGPLLARTARARLYC